MDWRALNAERLTTPKPGLHPVLIARVERLLDYQAAQGEPVLITQGLRSWEEQDKLYAQGRSPLSPGKIVTNARGGESQHNFGLAVDLCPVVVEDGAPDWNPAHPVWKHLLARAPQFQLAEGARWEHPDDPHFYPVEIPATTEELRAEYAKGGLPAVWNWFAARTLG